MLTAWVCAVFVKLGHISVCARVCDTSEDVCEGVLACGSLHVRSYAEALFLCLFSLWLRLSLADKRTGKTDLAVSLICPLAECFLPVLFLSFLSCTYFN